MICFIGQEMVIPLKYHKNAVLKIFFDELIISNTQNFHIRKSASADMIQYLSTFLNCNFTFSKNQAYDYRN
ncbi:hypothetical protein HYN49_04280 [Flavobacterium pallidum]|uniref:Uncharacterized protein n=1 Tax=Flavobacterium pallidum TaxID=2172098 RepID=A0A2S1SFM0_9FLAO|nr:hypothetical protein HYN49_04280 [Flavobacterium pallidum]